MMESQTLAERFEHNRAHLWDVAYRMLGSPTEAEDAVQETWLRLSRADIGEVQNLRGWLTTVTARVCLDMLRARRSRREDALEAVEDEPILDGAQGVDPEHEALLSDSVGIALYIVLENLTPTERVAFVLHDMFELPFDDIARIVGRSPEATRQLASRARRRVRRADEGRPRNLERQGEIVKAFLAASRKGDLRALIELLDPDVVLRADAAAVETGAQRETRGADAVARTFAGRAKAARPALIDGVPGLLWSVRGQPRVAFSFTVHDGRVTAIELIASQERLAQLDLQHQR
jgi:RNA polymerase sigma-70 factor (ECF subfamily)